MTTPADLKSYFEQLASTLGVSFVYGPSEKILNPELSGLQYPVIWLEVPMVARRRNGTLHTHFKSAFLCLSDKPVGDANGDITAMDEMYELTVQVLQKMQEDSEAVPVPFLFDQDGAESEYIGPWSADADWGWRTEFELTGGACENADCCD
ncbi:hypothetical protein EKK58_09710 [Candidatus Dependentiae bacterium]|nr:MAG: hypothetical protein EKK58_09710 [Candidatus Dependentiae bacterium]